MEQVTRPKHYTQGQIECIDAMESAFGAEQVALFCRMNAFKYVWRSMQHKDGSETNVKKAIWFLRMSVGDDPRLER
jgi:hypothetical protein